MEGPGVTKSWAGCIAFQLLPLHVKEVRPLHALLLSDL